ncbi:hypothetical protein [Paenibacillus koleovorans]|uniref:hypothetical protein n=1 Tax=Paenibacillus koleovorans TaxID=121608 RepID=UPI000FD9FF40|nr:hypothetical protein [Paenibacillus koleovorans]
MSIEANCMTCRKLFRVTPSEPQYYKLKSGQTKLYVCKDCAASLKQEAVQTTGLDPALLDPNKDDKFF